MAAGDERTIAELEQENETLRRALAHRDQDIARLKQKLDALTHRLFGARSEKLAPGQLGLLEGCEVPKDEEPAPDDEATHETPPRRRRKGAHGRTPLPKDLPRERVVHDLPESERGCPCCGETMQAFGEDVTEEVEVIPTRLFIRDHVRPKYSCRSCQQGVVQAPLPPRPIEKGRAGPGLLAQVLVSKYVDHLPLARQSRMFARFGLAFARSTLCDWVAVCVEEFEAIYRELQRAVLRARVIQADETPIVVLEDHNQKRRRQCWLWVYRGLSGETVFDFRPTRAREGPRAFLKDYAGFLQHDAYQGYGGLGPQITDVGCWAHARRHFFDARASAEREAKDALALIARLYAVERDAKDRTPDERRALREEHARPVLATLRDRLEGWARTALPKSDFGKAVAYARSQWPTLVRYVEDGDLAIDNNAVERAIRGVAVGRKNWLFAGSYEGGRRAAVLYTLIESCKAAGVEPFAYFADVLTRTTTATARELTPRAWKAAREAVSTAASNA
jgi:transposase